MARQCVKSLTCLTSTTYGIDTIIIPISQTWKLRHKDELTCQVPMTGWWNQVYDCWCNSHRAMPFISRELASPRIKITEPRDNCDLLLSHSFYRRRKAETSWVTQSWPKKPGFLFPKWMLVLLCPIVSRSFSSRGAPEKMWEGRNRVWLWECSCSWAWAKLFCDFCGAWAVSLASTGLFKTKKVLKIAVVWLHCYNKE